MIAMEYYIYIYSICIQHEYLYVIFTLYTYAVLILMRMATGFMNVGMYSVTFFFYIIKSIDNCLEI